MLRLFTLILISIVGIVSMAKSAQIIDAQSIKNLQHEIRTAGALESSVIGVEQAAFFWTEKDGTKDDFIKFCKENFLKSNDELENTFFKISYYLEVLRGHANKVSLDLKETLHLNKGNIMPIDMMFGSYESSAHLTDDLFENKIAFYILLNFPFNSLETKTANADKMSRKQWAIARLGEMFTSRVPANLNQNLGTLLTEADTYIAEYNIYMGNLVDDKFNSFFPKDMKLISHWNLRDELKSQYANKEGLHNQKMIYSVMKHIISQDIPQQVINKNDYQWNPNTNKIYKDKKEVTSTAEPCTRYEYILKLYKSLKAMDEYCPFYKTFIDRKFNEEMEIPQAEVEELFVKFISSPTIAKAAKLIEKRLGRKLEPFDIWYNGFKSRGGISEEELNKITRAKYPNPQALQDDIPNILVKLGFAAAKAKEIASKIQVDGARGAGHAWGADMKSEKAHLRTRISETGMDYKGYNIAIHELGHNVEQTLTIQDVDYWMLRSVPNTAFTEAWAFVFQKRDLMLLGINDNNPNKEHIAALENLWSAYEIMGVSLVDMYVWKWLYANPNASKEQLKDQVSKIAIDVWNKYFAPVFGIKDQPILAIYSHMIDNPLYLSAYPIGHLIEFQMENEIKGKNIGDEMFRICTQGRVIPQFWMQKAVGSKLSGEPTLKAAEEALKVIKD